MTTVVIVLVSCIATPLAIMAVFLVWVTFYELIREVIA